MNLTRNQAYIATGVTAFFCGCPGLFSCFMGLVFAGSSQVPGADIDMMGNSDPTTALMFGLGTLCMGLIMVLIPVVVGVLTLRGAKPAPQA